MRILRQMLILLAEIFYPRLAECLKLCASQTTTEENVEEAIGRSVAEAAQLESSEVGSLRRLLLLLAEIFYPRLAECLKLCASQTTTEENVEEAIGRSVAEAAQLESSEVGSLRRLLLLLAEIFYPRLAECLKLCASQTTTEVNVEEAIGRSVAEAAQLESSEVGSLRRLLLLLAEIFYPRLAECLKLCASQTTTEENVEEAIGRSVAEAAQLESSEVGSLRRLLLLLAEIFYPRLAECLKLCASQTTTEVNVEEAIGRSVAEAAQLESSEVGSLRRLLLLLAEIFYPRLAECLKLCASQTTTEENVEEAIGRSVAEAAQLESSEVGSLRRLLLLLAEIFYPRLAECLKLCASQTTTEVNVEEAIGRSVAEAAQLESSEVGSLRRLLLLLAEIFYPRLAECLKLCASQTTTEVNVEEAIGRSVAEAAQLESSEVGSLRRLLLLLAEIFYPRLAECLKLCASQTTTEENVEEAIGRSVAEAAQLESSEVGSLRRLLLLLAEIFYPRLAECLKLCASQTTTEVNVEEAIGRSVAEAAQLESSEVGSLRRLLLLLAEIFYPRLAECLKLCASQTTTEENVEEAIGRSVAEAAQLESSEVGSLRRLLLLLAEIFYPRLAECLKLCASQTTTEENVEEAIGRSVAEAAQLESSEVGSLRRLLLLLAEIFYPRLAECLKLCASQTTTEVNVEEAIGRSVAEAAQLESSEVGSLRRLLLLLAEIFYPRLAECLKLCASQTTTEENVEEAIGRSVAEAAQLESSEVGSLRRLLLLLAEIFYPRLAECLKLCASQTTTEVNVEEAIGRSVAEAAQLESSEVGSLRRLLLLLAEIFYPRLAECLKLCASQTTTEENVEEAIGRSVAEAAQLESSEVGSLRRLLLLLA
ncbi:hypothetical protein TcWFU_005195 [Taenia crassiceps]|uniref:Uncharacterized protein n=1 Tax=Taenia crassiceps TaxID=6207 RepID=A0ABR4Q5Q5_9CEST